MEKKKVKVKNRITKYEDGTKGVQPKPKAKKVEVKSESKKDDYADRLERFKKNLQSASPETKKKAAKSLMSAIEAIDKAEYEMGCSSVKTKKYEEGTDGIKTKKEDLSKDDDKVLKTKLRNAQAVAGGLADGRKSDAGTESAASRSRMGGEYTKQEKRALEANDRAKTITQEIKRRMGK